jgi:hypothetical protein
MPAIRCPFCNATGLDQLGAQPTGPFLIVYCKSCGAIHGVVPKPPTPPPKEEINMAPVRQQPDPEPPPPDPDHYLTPEKARLLNLYYGSRAGQYRRIVYTPGEIGEANDG